MRDGGFEGNYSSSLLEYLFCVLGRCALQLETGAIASPNRAAMAIPGDKPGDLSPRQPRHLPQERLEQAYVWSPVAGPAWPQKRARNELVALLSARLGRERHVGRTSHEFADLCQRLELGFVHVDHHPWMIDRFVQAQTSLETQSALQAQTSLDKTPTRNSCVKRSSMNDFWRELRLASTVTSAGFGYTLAHGIPALQTLQRGGTAASAFCGLRYYENEQPTIEARPQTP